MLIPKSASTYLKLDTATGLLFWIRARQGVKVGSVAGTTNSRGYVMVRFDGRLYPAHRIVWLLSTGEQPPPIIDHIDGDRANNRPHNLRAATQSQNNANSRTRRTLPKGVSLAPSGKYRAVICCDRRYHYLGSFGTPEEAAAAYFTKATELFGEFARP